MPKYPPGTRSNGREADRPTAVQGERLQKVLAGLGLGSRREIEQWIRAGRVVVDGAPASLGSRVSGRESIQVDGRAVNSRAQSAAARVLIYHKPEGEIVSHDDPERRPSVFDRLPRARGAKWLAVGRLDFNTGGLLVMTTSGELANRMMHPRYELEREYAVRIRGRISPEDMERATSGIPLEDGPVRFEEIEERGGEGANRWYRVVVREGRNRVVRRALAALGLTVSRLMRTRFGPIALPPRLTRGRYIELSTWDVGRLLRSVGMERPDVHRGPRSDAPRARKGRGRARR